MDIETGSLRGRKVIDSRGQMLGSVADVVIDPGHWHVNGLVVEVERDVASDLNLKTSMLSGRPSLQVSTDRIDAVGDTVLLNVDRDTIASLLRTP